MTRPMPMLFLLVMGCAAADRAFPLREPMTLDTDMNPVEGPFGPTLKSLTATGGYGSGEDIAQAVVFLASAKAGYITGAALTVDGGANA